MGQLSWFKGKPVVKKISAGRENNNKNKDVNMKRNYMYFQYNDMCI